MKSVKLITTSLLLGLASAPLGMAVSFDANVSPEVIFGSGNANGGFVVDQASGVELGLRAKVRLPTPLNSFPNDGAGTYSFPTFIAPPTESKVNWNYEFSINSDYAAATGSEAPLSAFQFYLGIDTDPSAATNFSFVDPLATWFDNAMGNNGTLNGGGDSSLLANFSPGNFNVSQNSQNLGWLGADGSLDATYDFVLFATDVGGLPTDGRIAETSMTVVVGSGGAAVPETGASVFLLGIALVGLSVVRRRLG